LIDPLTCGEEWEKGGRIGRRWRRDEKGVGGEEAEYLNLMMKGYDNITQHNTTQYTKRVNSFSHPYASTSLSSSRPLSHSHKPINL
jgi:hypothetical protein